MKKGTTDDIHNYTHNKNTVRQVESAKIWVLYELYFSSLPG